MLVGTLGIRLVLWLGKTVPLPPPPNLAAALIEVSVTNDADGEDGFQLRLTIAKDSLLDYGLLASGAVDPMTRVVIGVLLGASPEVLIDGVITHHQVAPAADPGASTLTVTGKALTQVLDLEERDEKYENLPDFLIFSRVIARYPQYGFVPHATPTGEIPLMVDRIPRQQESDLTFVRRLAERNGYVFYVEPITFGLNRAYFGPEVRAGIPQKALTVGLGPAQNVKRLDFTNDALAPVSTRGTFVEPFLKLPIPIPPLPSLRLPPLAASPAPARRTVRLRETAQASPGRAAATAVATVTRAPEAVRGSGELDAARYGRVLRARHPVGVRGAGLSYDGFYYVRRVEHRITKGAYTQSFSLSREGTGALLPVVPA